MAQITYRELADFVMKNMTEAEKNKPVKFYSNLDGEIYIEDSTSHPEINWSTKLIKVEDIYEDYSGPKEYYDGTYKNQYIIYPYITKEEERQIEILYKKQILLTGDLSEEERKHHEYVIKELEKGRNYKDILNDENLPPINFS